MDQSILNGGKSQLSELMDGSDGMQDGYSKRQYCMKRGGAAVAAAKTVVPSGFIQPPNEVRRADLSTTVKKRWLRLSDQKEKRCRWINIRRIRER